MCLILESSVASKNAAAFPHWVGCIHSSTCCHTALSHIILHQYQPCLSLLAMTWRRNSTRLSSVYSWPGPGPAQVRITLAQAEVVLVLPHLEDTGLALPARCLVLLVVGVVAGHVEHEGADLPHLPHAPQGACLYILLKSCMKGKFAFMLV